MIRKIDRAQIEHKLFHGDKMIFVDIRPFADYETERIASAIHVPLEQLEARLSQLVPDHGKEIVVYGRGEGANDAQEAAGRIASAGYFNIYVYEGGMAEWLAAGEPMGLDLLYSPGQVQVKPGGASQWAS